MTSCRYIRIYNIIQTEKKKYTRIKINIEITKRGWWSTPDDKGILTYIHTCHIMMNLHIRNIVHTLAQGRSGDRCYETIAPGGGKWESEGWWDVLKSVCGVRNAYANCLVAVVAKPLSVLIILRYRNIVIRN